MSISASLANALTGLTATSRRAEAISANVANASTPGYGVRQVNLSSTAIGGEGGGVRVDGISRLVDEGIIQDRRLTDAMLGDAETRSGFYARLEDALGVSGDPGSLSARIAAYDAALVAAASRPDSDVRLGNVVTTAKALMAHLGNTSTGIQAERMSADRAIAQEVETLNASLQQVQELNIKITAQLSKDQNAAALMDERQRVIDGISAIVPIRQIGRDHGQVALYTAGGVSLLDGKAAEITFTPTATITPDMHLGASVLSGLAINGVAHDTDSDISRLSGGSLIAHFAIRDEAAVEAQAQLDAVARDLVERFQNPAVDPTLGPTDPGMFTDSGGFFDTLNTEGISQRLTLNSALDPSVGGAFFRLRDGIGATAPGDVGNATQLQALHAALNVERSATGGGLSGRNQGFAALSGELVSQVASARQHSDTLTIFASVQAATYREIELQNGVDTDQQMQELLVVEAAFAANAKVVQVADELLDILTGL